MLSKIRNSKEKGFTIIEVLIVLAIAGLILIVVFLAIPALQRNARNTQRNNDISSLVGAINEYVNNTGGQVPASCTGATPCAFLANAKLGFYKADSATNFIFSNNSTATTTADPANVENIRVGSYSTCNAAGTASTGTGATSRSIAIVYDVETGGSPQQVCKTVQ